MGRPDGLSDFENPPLVEVVLGVQFEQEAGFRAVHYGLVRDAFRSVYPIVEEHAPLPPAFEVPQSSAAPRAAMAPTRVPFVLPRIWLISEDRSRLLQFQTDRLLMNWRKSSATGTYPRYETIRAEFSDALEKLTDLAASEGLDQIEPNQVEVTYLNHITGMGGTDSAWSSPETFFNVIREDSWTDSDARREDAQILIRHSLSGQDGEWLGRLVTQARPITTQERKRAIELLISAKGKPLHNGIQGAIEFMDWGRLKVASRFLEFTAPEMHNVWRRIV